MEYQTVSFCPHCGARIFTDSAKSLSIEWFEQNKEFRVNLSIFCEGCCMHAEQMIKKIPVEIEKESMCSCGEKLTLSDYSIKYIDNEIEFNGIYTCKKCNNKTKTAVGKIMSSIRILWRDTNKIEVGPTGIKFEKK